MVKHLTKMSDSNVFCDIETIHKSNEEITNANSKIINIKKIENSNTFAESNECNLEGENILKQKIQRATCKHPNCSKFPKKGGLCVSHGGGNNCQIPDCKSRARDSKYKFCYKHLSKYKKLYLEPLQSQLHFNRIDNYGQVGNLFNYDGCNMIPSSTNFSQYEYDDNKELTLQILSTLLCNDDNNNDFNIEISNRNFNSIISKNNFNETNHNGCYKFDYDSNTDSTRNTTLKNSISGLMLN